MKTPTSKAVRTKAAAAAAKGIADIKSKINSKMKTSTSKGMKSAMDRVSGLTGVKMPTSRKALKSRAASPKVKTAAAKAVKTWNADNKGMSTAMSALKKAGVKSKAGKLGAYTAKADWAARRKKRATK